MRAIEDKLKMREAELKKMDDLKKAREQKVVEERQKEVENRMK